MGYMRDKRGQRLDSYEPARSAVSTIATRVFGGRMTTRSIATATCFQVTAELAQDFDAVRLVLANTNGDISPRLVAVAASAPSAASDLNNSGGTWSANTTPRQLPHSPFTGQTRQAFFVSDWLPVVSVARTDGGSRPLVAVRAYMSASTVLPCYGNGTDDFTNWAARTDGRLWAAREQTVDGVNTPANFTSTTNTSQSPIVGIQYLARGRVITVFGVGDSITEGRGTYLNEGFILPAASALSDPAGVAVEYGNLGWNGQAMSEFYARALDLMGTELKPDVLVMPNGSPNDAVGTITATIIGNLRQQRAQVLAECQRTGVRPVLWTWLPTNTAVRNYGASDALRTAYNAETLTLAARGVAVADTAAAVAGATSGGQVQLAVAATADGIHPNDTGNAALIAVLQPVLAAELAAALPGGGKRKLQPADLPVFTSTQATNVVINESGIWTYAGSGAGSWTIGAVFPPPRKPDGQLFIIKVRDTAGGALTITASGALFQTNGVAQSTLTLFPGESAIIVNEGTYWIPIGLTAGAHYRRVATSAAATLTLDRSASVFVFTGSSATAWSLPTVSAAVAGLTYTIKNRGSAAITLGVTGGASTLYTTAAAASTTIAAGASATVVCDGTFWNVL